LQRTAPPSRLALTFSIKQTGVPAGVALAGALLPAATLAIGWRPAFAIVALAGAAVLALAQPIRGRLDADRDPRRRSSLAGIFAPLALLRQRPALLELALVSLVYSAMQVVLTSFLVAYLTETLHWSLVPAGFALTAATLGGVAGRIGWGHVADRFLKPRQVLISIGCLSAMFGVALTFATPEWPTSVVLPLVLLFGATAIGWNGVQLSEVARLADPGMAGKVTGATSFVTFAAWSPDRRRSRCCRRSPVATAPGSSRSRRSAQLPPSRCCASASRVAEPHTMAAGSGTWSRRWTASPISIRRKRANGSTRSRACSKPRARTVRTS
jgi:predicted MFS family arabinose efflux permease